MLASIDSGENIGLKNSSFERGSQDIASVRFHHSPPTLAESHIHLWNVDLRTRSSICEENILGEDEWSSATRFVFEKNRQYFIRARAALKKVLGWYLAIDPREVRLIYNLNGKPMLAEAGQLGFNLSHSGDRAVLAIGKMAHIGVDIEQMILPSDVRNIAETVFSPQEIQEFQSRPDTALLLPFFTCWTRKEAYLKAIGLGLNISPDSINVGTQPGKFSVPVSEKHGGGFCEVVTLATENGYALSLAATNGFSKVMVFDYHAALQ